MTMAREAERATQEWGVVAIVTDATGERHIGPVEVVPEYDETYLLINPGTNSGHMVAQRYVVSIVITTVDELAASDGEQPVPKP